MHKDWQQFTTESTVSAVYREVANLAVGLNSPGVSTNISELIPDTMTGQPQIFTSTVIITSTQAGQQHVCVDVFASGARLYNDCGECVFACTCSCVCMHMHTFWENINIIECSNFLFSIELNVSISLSYYALWYLFIYIL